MVAIESSLQPVASFATLGLLLLLGHGLRARCKLLRILSLPASCIGGVVGCILYQLLLSVASSGVRDFVQQHLLAGWDALPSLLTNIVFVTLVLGEPLPSPRDVWRLSGPQLAFGQFLAFGQYAVSALVTAAWLQPAFRSSIANRSPLFAAIVPLGFEGGHGVVTGLEDTLRSLTNSADDADILKSLGLVASTLGLLVGTMLGCGLVNWAAFRGYLAAPSAVTPEAAPSPAASAAAAGSVMGRAAAGKERSDGLERESGRRTTSASSVSGPEL